MRYQSLVSCMSLHVLCIDNGSEIARFSRGLWCWDLFFFQAEDGIRDLVRSRGLGDVYKRQLIVKGADSVMELLIGDKHHK